MYLLEPGSPLVLNFAPVDSPRVGGQYTLDNLSRPYSPALTSTVRRSSSDPSGASGRSTTVYGMSDFT